MLPHFSPGFSTMGRILGQMGRLDESMSAYARALSIDRQSQAALVGLARLHLVRGERDQARKILQEAQEFHPDDEKISDMLVALDLPRPWTDIKLASKALEQESSNVNDQDASAESGEPFATATLAEIYVKQGLLDKALEVYQGIVAQSPDNESAHKRIIQLQEMLGADTKPSPEETQIPDEPLQEQAPTVSTVEASSDTTDEASVIQSEPRDTAPLAVLQRWLSVIKNGRTNV
jgi:tetratricopeptide (TPR) repeat protein